MASWWKNNRSNESAMRQTTNAILCLPLLSANFAYLARDVNLIQKAGAQSVQIDVMDGHFVPNITVGPVVVESLRKETTIFLDVHLMIENPLEYIGSFAKAGSNLLTVHWEACSRILDRSFAKLRSWGSGRDGHPAEDEAPRSFSRCLKNSITRSVMTVEPGFGGQAFMPEMLDKVRVLRRIIDEEQLACELQVDGGINQQNSGAGGARPAPRPWWPEAPFLALRIPSRRSKIFRSWLTYPPADKYNNPFKFRQK